MKEPVYGKWLECRKGNMPEDYYSEGYKEVADWYESTPPVILSYGCNLADMRRTECIAVSRSRGAKKSKWHWDAPKLCMPTAWMAIPPHEPSTKGMLACSNLSELKEYIML